MQKKTYSDKLKDPRWQKKRLEVMERDEFTCQMCGDKESMLVVHHYKYDKEPWETDALYLVTLCAECHEEEHDALIRYKDILLKELEGYDSNVYLTIASLINTLKQQNFPLPPAADMLDRCLIEPSFFEEHVEKTFFKSKKGQADE